MPNPNDWIQLSPTPLDPGRAIAFVSHPNAGAIATFLGTTRAETAPQNNNQLRALEYETYPALATKQLHDLAHQARQKWPSVLKLAILHRTGQVPLQQPSVIIATSSPHRADAFQSCQWLIDTLKAEAAIWKKEAWEDNTTTWVHPDYET